LPRFMFVTSVLVMAPEAPRNRIPIDSSEHPVVQVIADPSTVRSSILTPVVELTSMIGAWGAPLSGSVAVLETEFGLMIVDNIPAPTRVSGFEMVSCSENIPGPTQITAPGLAELIAFWMDCPLVTVVVQLSADTTGVDTKIGTRERERRKNNVPKTTFVFINSHP
jgi:hypothetical protein